jgi:hypothetical protein
LVFVGSSPTAVFVVNMEDIVVKEGDVLHVVFVGRGKSSG